MSQSPMRPEFFKLDYGSLKKKKVAICVVPGINAPAEDLQKVHDLTIRHIKTHLFFYLNGNMKKLMSLGFEDMSFASNPSRSGSSLFGANRIDRGSMQQLAFSNGPASVSSRPAPSDIFATLIGMGIEFLICVPLGYFFQDEAVANILMAKALEGGQENLVFHLDSHLDSPPQPFVVRVQQNVESDFYSLIDSARRSSPTCEDRKLESRCQEAERGLRQHYERAFRSIFLFNTEGYHDINALDLRVPPKTVVGFASGFKLNYLAEKSRNDCQRVVFVDSNPTAVAFKRELFERWDGKDFVNWFLGRSSSEGQVFYEKSAELVRDLWSRELERWGGGRSFQEHWRWFQQMNVEFHCLDLIRDVEAFKSLLPSQEASLLWNSNMWHNEFIYEDRSVDEVFTSYQLWLTRLSSHNSGLRVIHAGVLSPSGRWIEAKGELVSEILSKCEEK